VTKLINEKLEFVERVLYFYFEGEFSETLSKGGIDIDTLNKWSNIAALYFISTKEKTYSKEESNEAFSLIEDLFVSLSVDIALGEEVLEYDFEGTAENLEIDLNKYKDVGEKAFKFIKSSGIGAYDFL